MRLICARGTRTIMRGVRKDVAVGLLRSMSKAVRLPLMAAFACLCLAAHAALAQPHQTPAPYALLMDADSRTVLFEKAADELMVPASMVKTMTAALVFEEITKGRLKLEDELPISENAWRKGGAPAGGSAMFAVLKSRVKVADLLAGLIVQSGNDAAIALAEGVAGSEGAFARRMTERARALGLTQSVFTNATGYSDPQQRVTARELARLALHIIETYPELYKMFGQREFTWNRIRQLNRNPLLTLEIGADGLKTGNIAESGFGLVASAVQNGQRLILVVNGLKTARDREVEARKLLEWGFRSFDSRQIFGAGETIGEASLYGGTKRGVAVTAQKPVRLLVPRGSTERIVARVIYTGPVRAPVAKGAEIGRLRITRGDTQALDLPVYAAEDVGEGPLLRRAMDAVYEQGVVWVRRMLGKGSA
jgi:serine-type D-Ala-D-Ala carboxypeptidase (penicillin-binding protein 5/6)